MNMTGADIKGMIFPADTFTQLIPSGGEVGIGVVMVWLCFKGATWLAR